MVGRPTRKAVSDQEDFLEGWVGSRGYFRGLEGVGQPSRRARGGREALLEGREKLEDLQEGQEG